MSTANINRPSAATRRTSGNSPARQGVARMIAAAAVTGIAAGLSPTWAPTASAAGEVADPERTSQVVTEWGAHRNVSPATVNTLLSKGYRIADIEVRSSSPRLDVSYVRNAGSYERAWWWYHGQSASQVQAKLEANDARLIDIEPYQTGKGTRYAVVMVKNAGPVKKSWAWHHNAPLSTITAYAKRHGMRVVDVERHASGSRFSAIQVQNSGVDAEAWWHFYNLTAKQVQAKMSLHQARPINLERRSNGRYDVVLQKTAGEYSWYRFGGTASQISHDAEQYGARVFQLKSYQKNGQTRYDALYISNVDAETRRVYASAKGISGDWGFYLKRVGGTQQLGIGEDNVFEPASMIKIVHAVTAMRDIQNTATSTGTDITWYAKPGDAARYPKDPDYADDKNKCAYDSNGKLQTSRTYVDDLGPVVIKQTMQRSDNRTTDALTRRYGFSGLNSTIKLAGMTSSTVNHRIGCRGKSSPQPLTNNALTLRDAGRIYEGVQNTTLLTTANRDQLYAYMNGGSVGSALRAMISEEAAAAGLTPSEANQFVSRVVTRNKGGSYTSCPKFDGTGSCNPNTRLSRTGGGLIWLPFRMATNTKDVPYVYGRYFNVTTACTFSSIDAGTCTTLKANTAAMDKVAVEMFRAEVKKALATWD